MNVRALLLRCVLAAIPLVCGANARAADPEVEARERFDRAVRLYEEGNYDAALVELQQAAALRPSYKLFYNLGQVRVALHDHAAALEAYRQYLTQGGDKVPAERRAEVSRAMKSLEQRVARLTIEADVAGAEVFVDDVAVGKTPLAAPVLVNSGSRRVQVRHPGHLPQSRVVSLAGGVEERVVFALGARPGRAALPEAPSENTPASSPLLSTPADERQDRSNAGLWIGWSATGALAVGAAVTGVMALSKNSELKESREQSLSTKAELDSEAKTVRTLAVVSDVLAASALVAGGVTLWLTLAANDPEGSRRTATRSRTTTRRLSVGVGATGAVLRGSF